MRSFVGVSVCNVRVPWLNGSTDRDEIWHTYSYGPNTHCVKLTQYLHAYVCQTVRWVLATHVERGRQPPLTNLCAHSVLTELLPGRICQLACW